MEWLRRYVGWESGVITVRKVLCAYLFICFICAGAAAQVPTPQPIRLAGIGYQLKEEKGRKIVHKFVMIYWQDFLSLESIIKFVTVFC